jgi:nucleotide sugar dehydrogenase
MVAVLNAGPGETQPRPERPRVSVFGAGRVGATIAAAWLRAGAGVVLTDIDSQKIQKINGRQPVFDDEPLIDETLWDGLKRGNLKVTAETNKAARNNEVIIIAVPAGLSDGKADLESISNAAKDIGSSLDQGSLVILETSVPPGTTRGPLRSELEHSSGLVAGRGFHLAYSPERISEGRALKDLEENYPKVVSGFDPSSLERVSSVYSLVARKGVLKMSSLEAAEAEKLFEGIYRDVNIALSNELADFCEASGLDYWELAAAANTQPFSHLHRPGLGVGGSCIPIYPQFILTEAASRGIELNLTREARRRNETQPERVLQRILSLIELRKGDKVAVLGLAFRGDISDDRFSPSYRLISGLAERGFEVSVHDSHLSPTSAQKFSHFMSLQEALAGAKLVVIATDHSEYKKLSVSSLREMTGGDPLIYDARGVFDRQRFTDPSLKVIGVGESDAGR